MKLLVLAQTPPPVHGQSIMVRTLVEGISEIAPDIEVIHANLSLSHNTADIGRARIGKIFTLWFACLRALWLRLRCGLREKVTLYYVPAPGRRAAVWRDIMAMFFLRPFFAQLVLHWHAAGLGEWLATKATAPERRLARIALGRAALSIVLAPELNTDARALRSRKVWIVANGIDVAQTAKSASEKQNTNKFGNLRYDRICHLLFLGQCSREKGLFALLDALAILQRETPGAFHLTIAGPFASEADMHDFRAHVFNENLQDCAHYAGPADDALKNALCDNADVFAFPTRYPHEAQPLVLIEAMAHDLPIVTTRWRAIPGMLPAGSPHAQLIAPDATPQQLASAIRAAHAAGPAHGTLRAHYEKHFTRAAHLGALATALRKITQAAP